MTNFLITQDWLLDNLNNTNVKILDIRSPIEYKLGHIPNAIFFPYEKILVFSQNQTHFEVAPKEQIANFLSEIGIRNEDSVVIYGDKGGTTATRLFWTLEMHGLSVKLLDISFSYWASQSLPTTDEVSPVHSSNFVSSFSNNYTVDYEYVLSKVDDSNTILLDNRSPDEFSGLIAAGPRPGRIPNSVNLPWDVLCGGTDHIFQNIDSMKQILDSKNITPDKEIICYCQVGERSSHTFLGLKLLNYDKVKLYDHSYSEWSSIDTLPVEV